MQALLRRRKDDTIEPAFRALPQTAFTVSDFVDSCDAPSSALAHQPRAQRQKAPTLTLVTLRLRHSSSFTRLVALLTALLTLLAASPTLLLTASTTPIASSLLCALATAPIIFD